MVRLAVFRSDLLSYRDVMMCLTLSRTDVLTSLIGMWNNIHQERARKSV